MKEYFNENTRNYLTWKKQVWTRGARVKIDEKALGWNLWFMSSTWHSGPGTTSTVVGQVGKNEHCDWSNPQQQRRWLVRPETLSIVIGRTGNNEGGDRSRRKQRAQWFVRAEITCTVIGGRSTSCIVIATINDIWLVKGENNDKIDSTKLWRIDSWN